MRSESMNSHAVTGRHARLTIACVVALLAATVSARAQDLVPKAAPQSRPAWIVNATLHTVSDGVLPGGSLLFADGVIQKLRSGSPGTAETEGCDVIDGTGKHVYPGWICATTVLGLAEVGQVDMSVDTTEAGRFKPEAEAAVAINPDSWLLPVTRRNGVLTCGVMPSGGVVSGRAAVIRLDGWTWEDMTVERDAGLCVQWPFLRPDDKPADMPDAVREIDELFDTAAAYLAAREADPSIATDLRYEAMAASLAGDRPLFISASTLLQIESAVRWAVGRGMRPVIVGAHDAGKCVDLLVEHDVPVIVTSVHRLPRRRDRSYTEPFELPAQLESAGVRWCVSLGANPFSSASARNVVYEAAAAVAHGLAPEAAVRSITLNAAACLGVDDRLGSLDPGKQATLFIADGDPFELSTTIERAFIDGREIVLEDKQTALYEKYREKYRQRGELRDDD